MTEQQYRVIADRGNGDDPRWGDVEAGDRYTADAVDRPSDDDTVVRIERPVPTTGPAKLIPWNQRADGSYIHPNDHLAAPSLPTREQIAEALYRQQQRPAVRIVWSDLPEWVRAVYFDMADAVLALLQKGADR